MFLDFFLFEIKYRLRRISTYVYFLAFFAMMLFSVSVSNFGPVGTGKINLNGPWAFQNYLTQLGAFGTFIVSAIFGMSILRDFHEDTYQLLFTKPISKLAYLGGRWAGSFVVTTLIFTGLVAGMFAGMAMPWADHTRFGPVQLAYYAQPFFSFTVIQIFFLGSLFFLVAAMTRRLMVVYLQGVVLFGLYLIGAITVLNTRSIETFWPSVFDPLGLVLFFSQTRYWTVADKNTLTIAWSGAFLFNRLLWSGIGLLSLISTFVFFPMSAEVLTRRPASRKRARPPVETDLAEQPVRQLGAVRLPKVTQIFGPSATWAQLRALVRLRFSNIVREIPFWAIAVLMVVLCMINGREAGKVGLWDVWPVTYLMTGMLQGSSNLFLYIIATLYAGELVWRERDVQFQQIADSLPVPGWVNTVSQIVSLCAVELILITVVMICGIAIQASTGYYHFELAVYFKELYLVFFPQILAFLLVAIFVQTMIANKFAGHAVVIGMILLVPVLYQYGFENRLFLFGEITPYIYSDMNGYGHFVPGLFWSITYWLAFGAFLGVLAIAFARRGTDLSWRSRWRDAQQRFRGLAIPALLFLAVFAGSGAWFYYNAHILNTFRTAKQERRMQADYERNYRKYLRLPQPKIVAVETAVDIYPDRRAFRATGHFTLVNHSSQPLSDVHITDSMESVDEVRFDRAFHLVKRDAEVPHYSIYRLDQALQPGDTMRMDFRASYTPHGFMDGHERAEMAYNGTFFDRGYFPGIGYDEGGELGDPVRRREEHLPPQDEMAFRGDPYFTNVNLFAADSDWITYKTVVSTAGDQIAVAPGYLKRQWKQGGRNYFEYDMGDTKIADFYSYISGRFAVKRDHWKNVKLEIYYRPGHEYNLDRMMDACKKGLAYFEENFGPYQFTQFRVLEFPRYRQFAQSFPNTVPYSEALGFIAHRYKREDIDEVFYITAHELAHQWWGHQLIGSRTQGSNMMSETLAQYSALMLVEKEYGRDHIRKFLRRELDTYLRGRGGEIRKEPPLALVQREPYVWYQKGSLVMYAMRDSIGEQQLNAALRGFLEKRRYASGPYPDTREFVAAMRAATPPDQQYLVDDLFNSIVLFDNKAVSATWTATPDHKYKVALAVTTRKLRADGSGAETEVPLNDLIEVGVFKGTGEDERPLFLEKRRITGKSTNFEMIVNEKPDRAGIDPYNKLIDRNPEDNNVSVSKQ